MYNHNSPRAIKARIDRNRNLTHRFDQGDVIAVVTSVSSSSEDVVLSGIPSKVPITHPFLSVNSWDRAMPEQGSICSVQYNKESGQAIITQYRNENASEVVVDYNSGNNLYRELASGEMDRMSSGMANTFHANRPLKFSRAGLVEQTLDGDTMTLYEKAPTFVRRLHQYETATLKDQELLGAVRRPKTALNSVLVKLPITEGDGFAKESTLVLVNKLGMLVDRRLGNVVDDDASFPTHPVTGNNLRLRERLYSSKTLMNPSEQYLETQVDNCGNVRVEFPKSATEGLEIVLTKGRFVADIGADVSLTVAKDVAINVSGNVSREIGGKLEDTVKGEVTFKADGQSTMNIGGYLTKLGIDGTHPLMFGDEFVKNLMEFLVKTAAHTHPAVPPSPEYAAACTALASALPNCVSRNVTTK